MEAVEKERNAFPSLYATLYPWLLNVADEHGYAVAIHGSLQRDLDIVAVPWTEEAVSAETLVEYIAEKLGAFLEEWPLSPAQKPHGRRVWALILSGGAYIDFSVMPRAEIAEH